MPSYQIYIPGERGAAPERLTAVGLDIHDAKTTLETIEGPGPDGGRGKFFYWLDPAHPEYALTPGYYPEQQEWAPAKPAGDLAAGRFWMGREKDAPVEPESILRKEYLTSTAIELADGQNWLIPAAPALPQKVGLDERGLPARTVSPRYQKYFDQVTAYYALFKVVHENFEQVVSEGLQLKNAWPFAVETLALNYRLDANLIDWLGLLDEMRIVHLILRTFEGDAIRLEEALKKKESAPPGTSVSSPGLAV